VRSNACDSQKKQLNQTEVVNVQLLQPMDSSCFCVMNLQRREARTAQVPAGVMRRVRAVRESASIEPQYDEVSCLLKRSSKLFGERWQRRFFFVIGVYGRFTLHYMHLAEEPGSTHSSMFSMFSRPPRDMTLAIEANSTV